eukprot:scaffold81484_cov31-Tisochrysis_lutea.AAC.14
MDTHSFSASPERGSTDDTVGCHDRGSFNIDWNRSMSAKKIRAGRVAANGEPVISVPSLLVTGASLLDPTWPIPGAAASTIDGDGGSSILATRRNGDLELPDPRPPDDREVIELVATGERPSRRAEVLPPTSGESATGLGPRGTRSAATASAP